MATGRLDSLTGLRVPAALLVFMSHSVWLTPGVRIAETVPVWRILVPGSVGVSFFFILSGFVLAWSARSRDRPRHFYARRVARIVPAHVVTWASWGLLLAAGVVTATATFHEDLTVAGAVASLLLVQAWLPARSEHFAMNAVSWSLSCEMFFYLCFPALVRPVARLGRRGLWVLAAAMVAVNWSIAVATHALEGGLETDLTSGGVEFWSYTFPPARLSEFVLGMALATLIARHGAPAVPRWAAVTLTAGAYLALPLVPIEFRLSSLTLVPFALVLVAYARADLDGERSVFAHPRLVHLGIISYAFYLVHVQVITVVQGVVGTAQHGLKADVAIELACLVLAGGLAELLYQLVEHPAERWLRPRLQGLAPGPLRPTRVASRR